MNHSSPTLPLIPRERAGKSCDDNGGCGGQRSLPSTTAVEFSRAFPFLIAESPKLLRTPKEPPPVPRPTPNSSPRASTGHAGGETGERSEKGESGDSLRTAKAATAHVPMKPARSPPFPNHHHHHHHYADRHPPPPVQQPQQGLHQLSDTPVRGHPSVNPGADPAAAGEKGTSSMPLLTPLFPGKWGPHGEESKPQSPAREEQRDTAERLAALHQLCDAVALRLYYLSFSRAGASIHSSACSAAYRRVPREDEERATVPAMTATAGSSAPTTPPAPLAEGCRQEATIASTLESMSKQYTQLLEYKCLQQRREAFMALTEALRKAYGVAKPGASHSTRPSCSASVDSSPVKGMANGSRATNGQCPPSLVPSPGRDLALHRKAQLLRRLHALSGAEATVVAPPPPTRECLGTVTAKENPRTDKHGCEPERLPGRGRETEARTRRLTQEYGDAAGLLTDAALGSFLDGYVSFIDVSEPYFLEDYAAQAGLRAREEAHVVVRFLSELYVAPVLEKVVLVYERLAKEVDDRSPRPRRQPCSGDAAYSPTRKPEVEALHVETPLAFSPVQRDERTTRVLSLLSHPRPSVAPRGRPISADASVSSPPHNTDAAEALVASTCSISNGNSASEVDGGSALSKGDVSAQCPTPTPLTAPKVAPEATASELTPPPPRSNSPYQLSSISTTESVPHDKHQKAKALRKALPFFSRVSLRQQQQPSAAQCTLRADSAAPQREHDRECGRRLGTDHRGAARKRSSSSAPGIRCGDCLGSNGCQTPWRVDALAAALQAVAGATAVGSAALTDSDAVAMWLRVIAEAVLTQTPTEEGPREGAKEFRLGAPQGPVDAEGPPAAATVLGGAKRRRTDSVGIGASPQHPGAHPRNAGFLPSLLSSLTPTAVQAAAAATASTRSVVSSTHSLVTPAATTPQKPLAAGKKPLKDQQCERPITPNVLLPPIDDHYSPFARKPSASFGTNETLHSDIKGGDKGSAGRGSLANDGGSCHRSNSSPKEAAVGADLSDIVAETALNGREDDDDINQVKALAPPRSGGDGTAGIANPLLPMRPLSEDNGDNPRALSLPSAAVEDELAQRFAQAVQSMLVDVLGETVCSQGWHSFLDKMYRAYIVSHVERNHQRRCRLLLRLKAAEVLERRVSAPLAVTFRIEPPLLPPRPPPPQEQEQETCDGEVEDVPMERPAGAGGDPLTAPMPPPLAEGKPAVDLPQPSPPTGPVAPHEGRPSAALETTAALSSPSQRTAAPAATHAASIGVVRVNSSCQCALNRVVDEALVHWACSSDTKPCAYRVNSDGRGEGEEASCRTQRSGEDGREAACDKESPALRNSSPCVLAELLSLLNKYGVETEMECGPLKPGEEQPVKAGKEERLHAVFRLLRFDEQDPEDAVETVGSDGRLDGSGAGIGHDSLVSSSDAALSPLRRLEHCPTTTRAAANANRFDSRVEEARDRLLADFHRHVNAMLLHILCECTVLIIKKLQRNRQRRVLRRQRRCAPEGTSSGAKAVDGAATLPETDDHVRTRMGRLRCLLSPSRLLLKRAASVSSPTDAVRRHSGVANTTDATSSADKEDEATLSEVSSTTTGDCRYLSLSDIEDDGHCDGCDASDTGERCPDTPPRANESPSWREVRRAKNQRKRPYNNRHAHSRHSNGAKGPHTSDSNGFTVTSSETDRSHGSSRSSLPTSSSHSRYRNTDSYTSRNSSRNTPKRAGAGANPRTYSRNSSRNSRPPSTTAMQDAVPLRKQCAFM